MPQIINTNLASLNAQRNLNTSQSANQEALSRLSSGLRINSAKDDAAGMAISTRFTAQIRGLNVAIRNVGDGVSLAQTADGALGTITDNLQRVRELAVQSANATNSDVDREALQAEVSQLVAEISRTGEQTAFNGLKLFDGEYNATFQIGANVGENVSFGIAELSDKTLGGGKAAGVSATGSDNALDNGDLVINGVVIGASIAADDNASTSNAAASAIAKAAAINKVSDQTGVQANVLTNVATGTEQAESSGGTNATSGNIILNGVTISIATGDVDEASDRSAVVTAINARSAETGVVAVDSGDASGGVILEAEDGRNISLEFVADVDNNLTAASTGLTSSAVTEGGYTLTSQDGSSPVVISAGTGTLNNAGLVEGSFSAKTAAVNSISRSSGLGFADDVVGVDTNTVEGGYDNVAEDGSFEAFTFASVASADGGDTVDTDFSTDAVTFDLTVGDTTVSINLNADYTNTAGVIAAINTQIDSDIDVVAQAGDGTDDIAFVTTATGDDAEFLISNYAEAGATSINHANGTYTGSSTTAAQLDGGDTVDTDFSGVGDAVTFTLGDGTNTVNINLNADYTDTAGVIDAINTQIGVAAGVVAVAGDGTDDIRFESTATGYSAQVEITNYVDGAATSINHADSSDLGAAANNVLTYNIGGADIELDLSQAPDIGADAYTDPAGGGLVIAAYIDAQEGLSASYDTTTNQFTIGASEAGATLSLLAEDSSALTYLGLADYSTGVGLSSLSEGDLKINGITISSSSKSSDTASNDVADSSDKAASGIAIATAINEASEETGVSATVNATVVDGGSTSSGTTDRVADGDQGVIYINNVATNALSLGTDTEANRTGAIDAINNITGQTGVVAEDAGGFIRLTAADGRNVSVAIDNLGTTFTGSNVGLDSSQAGIGEADFTGDGTTYAAVAKTTASTLTFTSAKEFTISTGSNGTDGLEGLGLVAGNFGGAESGQFLSEVDISTVKGAEDAILAVDNALATVSSQRAGLGAIQNRLESTVSNLTVTAENLTAANSRILDADFAVETANLSKSQVLQQAGISILAQANASTQQVLSLLQ